MNMTWTRISARRHGHIPPNVRGMHTPGNMRSVSLKMHGSATTVVAQGDWNAVEDFWRGKLVGPTTDLVIPCHTLSYLVIPCHTSYFVIPCHTLSYLVGHLVRGRVFVRNGSQFECLHAVSWLACRVVFSGAWITVFPRSRLSFHIAMAMAHFTSTAAAEPAPGSAPGRRAWNVGLKGVAVAVGNRGTPWDSMGGGVSGVQWETVRERLCSHVIYCGIATHVKWIPVCALHDRPVDVCVCALDVDVGVWGRAVLREILWLGRGRLKVESVQCDWSAVEDFGRRITCDNRVSLWKTVGPTTDLDGHCRTLSDIAGFCEHVVRGRVFVWNGSQLQCLRAV